MDKWKPTLVIADSLMGRPTQFVNKIDNVKHNINCVKSYAPNSQMMIMVKANAYGHGIKEIVECIPNDIALGVATLSEATAIRHLGFTHRILLLSGIFSEDEIPQVIQLACDIVVHHQQQITWLSHFSKANRPLQVWLKINTGMNRLGFLPSMVDNALTRLNQIAYLHSEIILMSHFACADQPEHPLNKQQLATFIETTDRYALPRSMANSAAIMTMPDSHFEWVRPGIMLYGVSPLAVNTQHALKPVMQCYSAITAITACRKNDTVGYTASYRCDKTIVVGVIPIGYGDGFPRHLHETAFVKIHQQLVPVIGVISMDMLTVDLSSVPNAKIGDPVLLWGEDHAIDALSRAAQTIAYEIFCHTKQR